jgi:HEAT repeat protein
MSGNDAGERLPTDLLFRRAVEQAASRTVDDDAYWNAIGSLQRSVPDEVWACVAPLADDSDARLRALVPDVLRFLGGKERPLREQTVLLLKSMLEREQASAVISAVAYAFIDLAHPAAVDVLRPFISHPDAGVREAAVHGLLPVAERAISALVQLSRDEDENVRNWATFGLGSQLGEPGAPGFVDTPEVRDALAQRLDDPHSETRAEASLGLAKRGDERAIPVIARELERETEWLHYVEAAEHLGDPRLFDALVTASKSAHPPADLSAALAACDPERRR